jgi:hypothetical protein
MKKIRFMNGAEAAGGIYCPITIGCEVCGINWCDICICDNHQGCQPYIPPCTDCNPVE